MKERKNKRYYCTADSLTRKENKNSPMTVTVPGSRLPKGEALLGFRFTVSVRLFCVGDEKKEEAVTQTLCFVLSVICMLLVVPQAATAKSAPELWCAWLQRRRWRSLRRSLVGGLKNCRLSAVAVVVVAVVITKGYAEVSRVLGVVVLFLKLSQSACPQHARYSSRM